MDQLMMLQQHLVQLPAILLQLNSSSVQKLLDQYEIYAANCELMKNPVLPIISFITPTLREPVIHYVIMKFRIKKLGIDVEDCVPSSDLISLATLQAKETRSKILSRTHSEEEKKQVTTSSINAYLSSLTLIIDVQSLEKQWTESMVLSEGIELRFLDYLMKFEKFLSRAYVQMNESTRNNLFCKGLSPYNLRKLSYEYAKATSPSFEVLQEFVRKNMQILDAAWTTKNSNDKLPRDTRFVSEARIRNQRRLLGTLGSRRVSWMVQIHVSYQG